ncbi:gp436 family protein [Neptunicella sp. SCSIO 80796]|uniref:gp436 family protein n=1 Tax=Neptunicella plasticusilytica TaxID=3117012 RepID=UPI003A4D1E80
MGYCTIDDLIERFGETELLSLTDRDNNGAIDVQVANVAIEDASATIDGFLAGRYDLPLSSIPPVLVRLCTAMARYNLYGNAVNEVVEKNNTAAVNFLTAVGKGDLLLGMPDTDESPAGDDAIEMQNAGTVFNRANSTGFI